jgi:hypothetical protein
VTTFMDVLSRAALRHVRVVKESTDPNPG